MEISPDPTTTVTLRCVSSGSPATTVTWYKDGEVYHTNDILDSVSTVIEDLKHTHQLLDGVTATYQSFLGVLLPPGEALGSYQCHVTNSLGTAASESLVVEGWCTLHVLEPYIIYIIIM